ncbi:MAG: hypothetical protein IAI50_13500 [Candidatus Eremiobacteraeota bacterium]|nr:hypothetical protein [Candidatus Eremiobacteraeota bacterium]
MNLSRWFLICAALAIAAACSSGSTNVTPSSSASSSAGAGSTAVLNKTVNFTVDIPAAAPAAPAAGKVHKLGAPSTVYLSPNTGSITINLVAVNGVSLAQPPPAQPATNVPTSCRGSATGCQVSVAGVVAATGINTYTVTTFAGADGEGAVVSTGVISATVTSSGTVSTIGGNPTELALGGYVASLALTVAPQNFTFGVPSKATVVVTPKDAAGATIVGNAQFAFPIVISVNGSGFTLSGPGLQSNGTIQLLEPQAASPPIVLLYNGSGTSATVTASSQNGSGATVTAPVVTVGAPTPTPVPTSTSISTLPPLTPSPIASGPTAAPTAAPSSFYVLNGYDNTIFEYSAPVNGSYSLSSRRGFGGTTLECASDRGHYALLGITTDPSANVYVGAPGESFGTIQCPLDFYSFPPGFSGPGGPAPATVQVAGNPNETDNYFEFAFDTFNGSKLDFSDDSLGNLYPSRLAARVATTGGAASPTLGYPVGNNAAESCFISPGLQRSDATCGNGPGGYFDEDFDSNVPFTVDSSGNLYFAAYDETTSNAAPVILKVTPANQVSAGTITAAAAWIEGPNTLLFDPVSLAYDAAKNSIWVYDAGAVDIDGSPGTPPPSAGAGTYLLEYPLSAFSGTGPQNISPVAFLSGQSFSRFATQHPSLTVLEPNAIAVGGGNVFVANQFSGDGATPAPPQYNGEVDAYSDAVTGVQQNTIAPSIYYGPNVRGPLGVAFGPHGTALGSGSLFKLPQNLPALRAAVIARQRAGMLSLRQRSQALRARRHH